MYAGKYMLEKEKLTTLDLKDSVGEALQAIESGDFLSLPVMDGANFKGYILKEAIYRKYFELEASKESFLKDVKVGELYTEEKNSIQEDELVEKAAYLLKEFRTPFLPVLNEDKEFLGILTHTVIFEVFAQIVGLGRGSRIVINLYDIPGQLASLASTVKKENINILNFSAIDTKVMDVFKVILRVDTKDEAQLKRLIHRIEAEGFKVGEVNK